MRNYPLVFAHFPNTQHLRRISAKKVYFYKHWLTVIVINVKFVKCGPHECNKCKHKEYMRRRWWWWYFLWSNSNVSYGVPVIMDLIVLRVYWENVFTQNIIVIICHSNALYRSWCRVCWCGEEWVNLKELLMVASKSRVVIRFVCKCLGYVWDDCWTHNGIITMKTGVSVIIKIKRI